VSHYQQENPHLGQLQKNINSNLLHKRSIFRHKERKGEWSGWRIQK